MREIRVQIRGRENILKVLRDLTSGDFFTFAQRTHPYAVVWTTPRTSRAAVRYISLKTGEGFYVNAYELSTLDMPVAVIQPVELVYEDVC